MLLEFVLLFRKKMSRLLHMTFLSLKAAFAGGWSSVWEQKKRRKVSMEMPPLAGIRKLSHDLQEA